MAFSLVSYVKESVAELRKVAWPTRPAALRSTGIVLGFSVLMASFLGLVDYLFTLGINYLINYA
ncbi:MAG: hypothetical protein ACD_41C00381G0001 [uncultured bacterium]|nr:MAG: hypothetical protein ACD_41C00381G0001 [uncultured bacterium]HBY73945.1 preprotein translocase subunit SecE [Candidatus Kerfeldbacteria bacterium]